MLLSALATLTAQAQVDISTWRTAQLASATTGVESNWYFHPDSSKNPRVLVKATGTTAKVNYRYLSGGPPTWTTGAATALSNMNKQGVVVPFVNGIYFIAPHNNVLRMTFFNAAGTATISEIIDNTMPISSIGLSAALDTGNGLHVAYVGNPNTTTEKLGYAFRSASGTWKRATAVDLTTLSQFIRQTAMLPSGSGAGKIYASFKTGSTTTLLRVSVANNLIVNAAGDGNQTPGANIAEAIAGNRLGGVDRVYYFAEQAQQGFWSLKQAGLTDPIQNIGFSLPTSIICKPGPDNKQRIVWSDGISKKLNYLKPGAGTDPFDVSYPVKGTSAIAEVRGLHFDANDKPYLLYQNSPTAAFIAFPDEERDSDGNGREDLIDYAFNSSTAGIQILNPALPAAGFPLSENKFKFTIPTIGSTIANGTGLISATQNLTYGVETSTDRTTWTPLGTGSQLFFAQSSATGLFPNELKTFTAFYNEAIPNATKRRFFRVTVKRTAYPY
ncbi:hypothetical protein [Luteolibacter soli]|uniref:Uncharacterized protein n=1 Tax=Luteolibacter soli TaxID=3135280 RepID=A0ABU9AYK7_9BACT